MESEKNVQYLEKHLLLAQFAKALSHPARLYIMELLSKQTSCYSGDITDEIPIARSTLSQHLKELKLAGLIQGCTEPPKIRYCIEPKNWELAKKYFTELFNP
jgi:ArsR family transcriptional regulator, arsenate/arsenite/antimonite-responsive transcriptional repressor